MSDKVKPQGNDTGLFMPQNNMTREDIWIKDLGLLT